MRKFDKLVYALHKWSGLITGLFLLLLSITGTLLVFRDEIDRAFNAPIVSVNQGGKTLSYNELIKKITATHPDAVLNGTFLYNGDATRAVMTEIMVKGQRTWVYVNPYTGDITGERLKDDVFIVNLLHLHEHLTIGKSGHVILFVVGLCFILSVVSGLWYYRKSLFSVYKIGIRRKTSYLTNSDLHKWIGVSASLFLLLMALTGTFMHWEKVERILDSFEQPEAPRDKKPEPVFLTASQANYAIDSLLTKATQAVNGFMPQYVGYPRTADEALIISGTRPESSRLLGKFNTSILFELSTGAIKEIKHKEDNDLEANMESSVEQLHFGEYGGWFTKLIYGLGGMGLCVMTITGFVIWWKKR